MEVTRIGVHELKQELDSGQVIILDVRNPNAWAQSEEKLPSAVRIPLAELEARWQELPKEKLIVAY